MLGSSSVQCPSPRDSPGRIVPSVGLSMLPVTQRGGRGLQGSGRHRARAEQTRGSSRRRVYRPELRGKRRRLPRARLPERGHLCGRREHLQLPLPARVDRHVHAARAQREGGAPGSEGPRQPAGPWGPVPERGPQVRRAGWAGRRDAGQWHAGRARGRAVWRRRQAGAGPGGALCAAQGDRRPLWRRRCEGRRDRLAVGGGVYPRRLPGGGGPRTRWGEGLGLGAAARPNSPVPPQASTAPRTWTSAS